MSTADLKGIHVLAGLNDDALAALARLGKAIELPSGHVVVKQGQIADAMYFVLRGKVTAYASREEGGEIPLKTIEQGGHFGEIGLLHHGARTANVRTASECTLFRLDREAFQQVLKLPEIAIPLLLNLGRSLALRLAAVNQQLSELKSFKQEWAV